MAEKNKRNIQIYTIIIIGTFHAFYNSIIVLKHFLFFVILSKVI